MFDRMGSIRFHWVRIHIVEQKLKIELFLRFSHRLSKIVFNGNCDNALMRFLSALLNEEVPNVSKFQIFLSFPKIFRF